MPTKNAYTAFCLVGIVGIEWRYVGLSRSLFRIFRSTIGLLQSIYFSRIRSVLNLVSSQICLVSSVVLNSGSDLIIKGVIKGMGSGLSTPLNFNSFEFSSFHPIFLNIITFYVEELMRVDVSGWNNGV